MSDVTPSSPGSSGLPSPDGQASGGVDPFETLYKMSTTAGLGSGEYVAVNGTAVAAALLGIASAVVLFRSPVLLLIPLIGVVCAIVAFVQISRSNGTQTGREAAAVGLLLSLGLGGFVGYLSIQSYIRNNESQASLSALIKQFGEDIRDDKLDAAYALCDAKFTGRVGRAEWDTRWEANRQPAMLGVMTGMESTRIFSFEEDPASGDRLADGMVKVNFSKIGEYRGRLRMGFRFVGDSWKVDQIDIFPQEQKKQGQQPAPQPPPAAVPSAPLGPMGPQLPLSTRPTSK
jgi:hypothetical protein